jgi:hypothetical protein
MLDIFIFGCAFRTHLLLLKFNLRQSHKIKTKYSIVSNLPFIFNTSFVLLHIEMLVSGTMNVVAFLFIREEWRFYVGALFLVVGALCAPKLHPRAHSWIFCRASLSHFTHPYAGY